LQHNLEVNATGDVNNEWKIGVLFNSTLSGLEENNTINSTISIIDCFEYITVNWDSLYFNNIIPYSTENSASGNSINQYNISVDKWSCDMNLWIKGTDLTNNILSSEIGAGNITWNDESTYSTSKELNKNFSLIKAGVPESTNQTTFYCLMHQQYTQACMKET